MVAMVKSKAGHGRAFTDRKKNLNNNNRNKKNLENGLYVHSSPPKALNSNNGQGSATIRDYIRAGAIEALEEVVLQGQGTKLVNQPATDQKVRNFLKTVPSYMSKIDLIHDAVEKGNLRDLKALLDRRKLARSKDAQGVGLLHKAVVHDHKAIVDYLIADYPETLDVTDHNLSASRMYQVLETLQEVPEDQSPERLPPAQAPPSSPTVDGSFQPNELEFWEGGRPNRGIDTAESKPLKGAIKSNSGGRKVDGLLEMARLNLMEGLELEVADWSEDDANTCYSDISSPEKLQHPAEGEREVFSPELSSTINKLLSRGRSGRLPRLSTPMNSPEVAGNRNSVTRLIDHGMCVGPDAMYPPLLNKSNLAYETHLQRMGRIRRPIENDEKQIAPSRQRKPLRRPPLLPGIQHKPHTEPQEPANGRPLTPTPSGATSAVKQRWRKLNPQHSDTIKNHIIADRLHDMFKNLSDSDHENDTLDTSSVTDPSTHDSVGSNSSGSSSRISPAFDRTSSVLCMENDSGVGSPGNEENLLMQEIEDDLNLSILSSNKSGGRENKQSQKVSFGPGARKIPQRILTHGSRPTRIYRSISDGQRSLKFNLRRSKIPVLQRARSEGDIFSPLARTKHKTDRFRNRSSTTSRKLSDSCENNGPPFVLEDLPEIPEASDISLYTHAQAAPYVQKYIRWLTRRIIGETFVDLKKVYAAAIKKHNSKKEIMDIVYDHDVDYWARVIVERVCKRVETSILNFDREGTLNFR